MARIAILLAALLLAGCGSHKAQSAEQVARSWSAALDRNDNEAARPPVRGRREDRAEQ